MKTKTIKLKSILNVLLISGLAGLSLASNAEINDTIDKTFDFDRDGKIELENINGDVTFTSCDCDHVTLVADIMASSQEMRDRISVKIDSSSNRLKIKTKYKENKGSSWNNERSKVTYKLEVPKTVALDGIKLINGNLKVKGVSGALEAEMINGDLHSDGLSASTRINMVNGDINLKFADLSQAESVRLESVNGKIAVYLPSDADVSVKAETVSGSISNDFGLEVIKHKYVGSEMKGDIGNGRVSLNMDNVNGKITLKSL